ncbi:MAG TPA: hypothetical protein VKA31_07620 [Mariprofundaceae bacterium]|nr:hypothetical protein [Mariprofundaceae bacterium]
MSLKKRLEAMLVEHDFLWMEIAGSEGLSLCEAGAEELPELAARLPDFLKSGDRIAKAAQLGHGMGFMLLMPRQGAYALLMRSFDVRDENFVLVVGTAKLPSKPKQVLDVICNDIGGYL